MKHYLMVFRRPTGEIVRISAFDEAATALTARFDAEAEFQDDGDVEVVVLGATSEEALKRTHARYFQSSRELAAAAFAALRRAETRPA